MATRGLLASLAILVTLVAHPALGQWVGQMDENYGVRQTSFSSVPTTAGAAMPIEPVPETSLLQPGAALAPAAPAAGPLPGFSAGASENSPCAADGDSYCCPPNWSLDEGVRVLTRSRTRPTNLSYELLTVAPGQTGPMTTKALGFDVAAGYYATVAHYLGRDTSNRDQFVEFGYWGMNTWDAFREANGVLLRVTSGSETWDTGSLMSYFDPTDHISDANEQLIGRAFNNVLEHDFYYRSEIHNFEVNVSLHPRGRPDRLVLYPNGRWRRERQPGCYLSYLAGLRCMLIDEEFAFAGSGYTVFNNDSDGRSRTTNSGRYDIRTHNDMFGFQIGGELVFRDRLWEFGARYKLGPMLNYADQRSVISASETVRYTNGTTQEDDASAQSKAHNVEVSGLAEIGVKGVYKLAPNLNFHAAYDWIFITNLALAPEQVDYHIASQVSGYNSSRVNTNGHALYHGLTLGLEFIW